VVISASTLTSSVTATSRHALVAVLRADKVWEGLGILGGIRGLSVATDTIVGEGGRIAVIGISRR